VRNLQYPLSPEEAETTAGESGAGGTVVALTPRMVRIVALVVVTIVLAGAVRLIGLTREPLFVDEAFSARFSTLEVNRILDLTARDIHPPLYYLGLASWRGVFGDTVWGLRSYSVLWSLIGLGALALLARRLVGDTGALLAVIAMAVVHPLDVYFAQTARMYSQLAALSTLAAWLLWRWMTSITDEDRIRSWPKWAVAYAATAVLLLYTHYLGVVVLMAQGIFALGYFARRRRWSSLGGYLLCAGLSAAAFWPWIAWVLRFRDELYSQRHLIWIPATGIKDGVGILFRELMWGRVPLRAPWATLTFLAAVCIVVGAALLLVRSIVRPANGRTPIDALDNLRLEYALWLLFGPVTIAIIVGQIYQPIYYPPRFALLVLPPFLILLGRAFEQLGSRCWRWRAAALVFALMAASTVIQSAVISRICLDDLVELWRSKSQPARVVFFPAYTAKTTSYYLGERVRSATREDVEGLVTAGVSASIWVCTTRDWRPRSRADREFRKWLLALGPHRSLVRTDDLEVVRVSLRCAPGYPPPDRGGP